MSKIVVRLEFSSDDLDPERVTRQLGIPPTTRFTKGELVHNVKTNRSRAAQTSRWMLELPATSLGEIDKTVANLFSGATNDVSIWRGLAKQYSGFLSVTLHAQLQPNDAFGISPDTLAAVSGRGLTLDIDVWSAE